MDNTILVPIEASTLRRTLAERIAPIRAAVDAGSPVYTTTGLELLQLEGQVPGIPNSGTCYISAELATRLNLNGG